MIYDISEFLCNYIDYLLSIFPIITDLYFYKFLSVILFNTAYGKRCFINYETSIFICYLIVYGSDWVPVPPVIFISDDRYTTGYTFLLFPASS